MALSENLANRLSIALTENAAAAELTSTINDLIDGGVNTTDVDLGTAAGVAGSLDIFPGSATKGKLHVVAAASSGDTTTTITNASQSGAHTYTIPDAGASASFVMTGTAAQTIAGDLTVSGTLTNGAYATSTVHLIAGASGTVGDLAIFPTTGSKGKLLVTKADNTNNDTTTINVAAQGGAYTYTVPDAGAAASFLMTDGAIVINEGGAATGDVRIESDTVSTFFNIDANGNVIGCLSIGAAVPTNPQALVAILPPANATGVTTNQSYHHLTMLPGGATVVPAGTAPIASTLNLHEPNLTATGTITAACTLHITDAPTEGGLNYALWVDAGVSRFDGNLDFGIGAADLLAKANTAAALRITDGTTAHIAVDTRSTVSVQNIILQGPASQTLPDGATSRARIVSIPAKTITLAGTTQVTTEMLGIQMFIDAPTINQSGGAVTVDRMSTLHVGGPAVGASVTGTLKHIISTDTAGCFCTVAGTWTDTSGLAAKTDIVDADFDDVMAVLDEVEIKRFRYKDDSDGNITRIGGIAEHVPVELSMPGRQGIAARDVAWLAVASAKKLRAENQELKSRLDRLEAKLKP